MTQKNNYSHKQFKRHDDSNNITCGSMLNDYELMCTLLSEPSYILSIGLAPLHPLIRSMLCEAKCHEIVNMYALFRLPQACEDPDFCRVRQKSYNGYAPDTDKYVTARLGKIVRDIFVSKTHDEITQAVEWYGALHGERELCFTQSDQELKDIMLWMTKQHVNISATVPRSCMTNPVYIGELVDKDIHPYQAYAHALGWSLAYVPVDPDDYTKGIVARAIVNRKTMRFVRTFSHTKDHQVNERMNHMLVAAGYEQHSSWTGYEILKINRDCLPPTSVVMPFFDGDKVIAVSKGDLTTGMDTLTLADNGRDVKEAEGFYDTANPSGVSYLMVRCAHCGVYNRKSINSQVVFVDGTEGDLCNFCARHHYSRLSSYYYTDNTVAKNDDVVETSDSHRTRQHNILKADAVFVSRYNMTLHRKDTVYAKTTDEYIPIADAVRGDTDWEYRSLVEVNEVQIAKVN